ncbi:MAG TPA: hypothetical protein VLB80_02070 [Candidatus Babeliales bacterium]|nr:hypothetical protein [Candidatus Babeliales bacterium]
MIGKKIKVIMFIKKLLLLLSIFIVSSTLPDEVLSIEENQKKIEAFMNVLAKEILLVKEEVRKVQLQKDADEEQLKNCQSQQEFERNKNWCGATTDCSSQLDVFEGKEFVIGYNGYSYSKERRGGSRDRYQSIKKIELDLKNNYANIEIEISLCRRLNEPNCSDCYQALAKNLDEYIKKNEVPPLKIIK